MKVEVVKVKISKLNEIRKQLRCGKIVNEKNLKSLLLSEDKDILISCNKQDPQGSKKQKDYFETSESTENLENILSMYTHNNKLFYSVIEGSQQVCPEGFCNSNDIVIACENIKSPEENNGINCKVLNGHKMGEVDQNIDDQFKIENLLWNNNVNSTVLLSGNKFESTQKAIEETAIYSNSNIKDCTRNELNKKVELMNVDDFCNEIEVRTSDMHSGTQAIISEQVINDSLSIENKGINYLIDPFEMNNTSADLKKIVMNQLEKLKETTDIDDTEDIISLSSFGSEQKTGIISAAKHLYTKRTRTLLHWIDPKLSMSKLKSKDLRVSWKNLPISQREVYIKQVLGTMVLDTTDTILKSQIKMQQKTNKNKSVLNSAVQVKFQSSIVAKSTSGDEDIRKIN